jgi:hypothetical protein
VPTPACFSEPPAEDLSWGRYDSDQLGWLERSTGPQARAIRDHLNTSLAALPVEAAIALCRRFRTDPWRQVYFELVVGRFLQVLGATLDYEPVGANGRKVDWQATFPDGKTCYVEATSPVTNAWLETGAKARGPLLQIIEDLAAPGWSVIVSRVPDVGPRESRGEFKRVIREIMATLPDAATVGPDDHLERSRRITQGDIKLRFLPVRYASGAIVMSSGGAGYDDTALRIEDAIRDKRAQGRAFPGEVLLAIDAPFGDREDCDSAIFGHAYSVLGDDFRVVEQGFRPDGALSRQRRLEYPAVLVFKGLRVDAGRDPVLYVHPKLDRALPPALDPLEHHWLEGGAIRRAAARRERILDGLGFASLED